MIFRSHLLPGRSTLLLAVLFLLPLSGLQAQFNSNNINYFLSLMRDSVYSITSLSGTLYTGIDNELKVCPGNFNAFQVSTDNGKVFREDKLIILFPSRAGRTKISFSIFYAEDTLELFSQELQARDLPYPSVYWGNMNVSLSDTIDKYKINSTDSLYFYFSDDIPASSNWLRIKHISIGYRYGNYYLTIDNPGNLLLQKTKNLLLNMKPGQEITLQLTTSNESGITFNIPPIRLKVK
jgi:hypothetical protein